MNKRLEKEFGEHVAEEKRVALGVNSFSGRESGAKQKSVSSKKRSNLLICSFLKNG